MKIFTFSMCAAAAMLTGCGGSQSPIGAPGAMPQSRANAQHANPGGSWMLPEAKSEDLLYISNVATISVYTYRTRRLVGTLTGFGYAWGLCTDKSGDVFVTDWSNEQIYEYAHGGTAPIDTLDEPNYRPDDCSVDLTTGKLAVTNYSGPGSNSYSSGSISVYTNAQGTPQVYAGSHGLSYAACSYDDKGNLYADGSNYTSGPDFQLVELAKGQMTLQNLKLRGSYYVEYPGGLQWDGKYVALGNASNVVYQLRVHNGIATVRGATTLQGPSVALGPFWIPNLGKARMSRERAQLVALDVYNPNPNAQYYHYPAGGTPTHLIDGLVAPIGVTVSVAQ
jgi:hypothetical protein